MNRLKISFCEKFLIKASFLLFLLLSSYFNARCQRSVSPQAQRAIDFFEQKQYVLAQPEFEKLIEKYPKDILYQYYLGACMVENNVSYMQAINYLKNATAKNVANSAWYYLGKAYYRQYRFDEAKLAFEEMKSRGTFVENKNLETNKELDRIAHAKTFYQKAEQLESFEKYSVSRDSIFIIISKKMGVKTLKADVFNGKKDSVTIIGCSSFETGKEYYFSAPASPKNNRKDIFKVKRLSTTEWGKPENLGTIINTADDEDFPYFDSSENMLYFASKGHGSVGGYDILKTKFNSTGNVWDTPEQLVFTYNTPFNDLLLIPYINGIILVSDRENRAGIYSVYKLKKMVNKELRLNRSDEILTASFPKQSRTAEKKSLIPILPSPEVKTNEHIEIVQTYNRVQILELSQKALVAQSVADSALWIVKKLKSKLLGIDDKAKKATVFSEISRNEKIVNKYQSLANTYFDQVKLQLGLVVNENSNNAKPKENMRFIINTNSPYSKENPIPTKLKLPEGVIYSIQLGVFSKQVDFNHFGGIEPISAEVLPDGKIIKYFAGVFYNFDDADSTLSKVKEYGFKEAFVVAYLDNKKIPVERAKDLENTGE